MWTAPVPAWNQTSQGSYPDDIQTAVIRVLNGSTNVPVRWNYTLLDGQSIFVTQFYLYDGINPQSQLGLLSQGKPLVYDEKSYRTRFSIDSKSEFSTLTINTVTERENATFQCRIFLFGDTSWVYNIQIVVTGKALRDF